MDTAETPQAKDAEVTPVVSDPAADVEADGYYGDDEADSEELDLSFLDEEEADEDEKPAK
jgi:hypothetical protein